MSDIEPAPAWRRSHHLRRGGWFTTSRIPAPSAAKASAFLTRHEAEARTVLANTGGDPDLAAAGRAALDDPAHATGLGLAVVIAAAVGAGDWRGVTPTVERAEPWASRHGLPLAAETAVALAGIRAHSALSRRDAADWLDPQPYHGWPDSHNHFSAGVRARLATASDEDHAAAEAALAPWREHGLPLQRLMTSFLMPHRQDWVDEDLSMVRTAPLTGGVGVPLLLSSVRTGPQLEAAAAATEPFAIRWTGGTLTSMVEGVGADALPVLLRWFDEPYIEAEARRRCAAMIAALPSDEAFQVLLDRAAHPAVRAALADAATRYPRRAVRLAAGSGAPAVAALLRVRVAGDPAMAEELLPELAGPPADRVRAALAATAEVTLDAPAGNVPAALTALSGTRALPSWATPAGLPRIALRDGSGTLPPEAVGHLLAALSAPAPSRNATKTPAPGRDAIKTPALARDAVKTPAPSRDPIKNHALGRDAVEALDPGDRAEFGWALFERWQAAGAPAKESWALTALGLLGDDGTVRRLTPVIRAWPGEGGHRKAVLGLSVLAAIGTGVALMHLHGIAQRVTFKALKDRAGEKIAAVAATMGLSAAQLADRLVPDLGLSADGSLLLDYGPRQFTVGFDEQLRPYVTDAAGRRLKSLPKPGVKDDPAAYSRFGALKKDVRMIAADQVRRLERSMVEERRWSGAEFREFLAGHPLLWHLVRRLVWGVVDGPCFRVAEDRTFATADDTALTVPDDAVIHLPHPAAVDLAPWAGVFTDYEIVQPFPQIHREVFTQVGDVKNVTVPVGRVLGLEPRGWRRGCAEDNGVQGWIERPVGDGLTAAIMLDPGIAIGAPDVFPEQTLEELVLLPGPAHVGWRRDGTVPWDRLSPTAVSELARDLNALTQS
ncbi:DUF4132 domain-containing protein [Catenuloplanes sp. NPDC051500]|uniref:DUF4132 domain-containing protein n=1 Tax=Catenuloplanes sp. NPDC051500 TaxID=3363959 RepID=UPI0037A14AFE